MQRESGSTSLAVLAAIGAIFMASLYVTDSNQKMSSLLSSARLENSRVSGNSINLSNLSQLKALLNNRKISAGVYESGIYPQDYFSGSWDLRKQAFIAANVTTSSDFVQLPFVEASEKTADQVKGIFEGTQKQTDGFLSLYRVAIVAKNRHKDHPTWIESVDVESSSTVAMANGQKSNTVKTLARVALDPPLPGDLTVWIKGPGKATFDQNFGTSAAPLPAGNYTLQLRASGVVHYAELTISGTSHILGLDPKTGLVTHSARNIKAVNEVIGTYDLDFNPTTPGPSTSVGFNETTCTITASPAVPGANTVGFAYEAAVYGVNGVEASGIKKSGNVYIDAPTPAVTPGKAQEACKEQCTAGSLWAASHVLREGVWGPLLDDGILNRGDPAVRNDESGPTTDELLAAGVSGRVCHNYDLLGTVVRDKFQMMPTAVVAKYGDAVLGDAIHEAIAYRQTFAFVAPKCEKQVLGERKSCGCFATDTRILMADGSQRAIQDLKPGDFVRNPKTGEAQAIARMIAGPEVKPMYEIISTAGVVTVTEQHPFLTPFGLVQARALLPGTFIVTGSKEDRVIEVRQRPVPTPAPIVWNLELAGSDDDAEHFVWADGIMTGDLKIQERLAGKRIGSYP